MLARRGFVAILALLILAIDACGPTRRYDEGSLSLERAAAGPSTKSSFRYVGRADVLAFQAQSLGDALRHLRPDWLRANPAVRGPGENTRAVVYTNDVLSGDLNALEMIPATVVDDVRLLTASQARVQFGPTCRCAAGVILVSTRRDE
jgi:hypothetical protein